jgi:glyoxylase-like metal-dependent hydrolase (beta-lactamase superfamily II)/rhodanese-related sulfurtransferase
MEGNSMKNNIIFYQLFERETSTYTYLLGDPVSREAVIIDPVVEMVERDVKLIQELGLKLKYILDTHVHADHITGSGELRKLTDAQVALSSTYDLSCPDIHLEDGQELSFGGHIIKALSTPGHTNGCLSYQLYDMVFTGDVLLVRGCGRTDFQEGSSHKLFASVREKLFSLPDNTTVYPAHDYKGFTKTSIRTEKKYNPRLNLEISEEHFVEIMANLKLAYPKKIQEAVPANLVCGLPDKSIFIKHSFVDGISTVIPEDLHTKLGDLKVIDVRGNDEFNNELGHILNAELAPLGPVLDKKLDHENHNEEIVFVCRSGKRSAEATKLALKKGFENVYNLQGGMLRWKELNFPSERDRGGS